MPDPSKILIVDTRALVSLAKSGVEGLNTLLSNGQQVVILRDVFEEIRDGNTPATTRSTILQWLGSEASPNHGIITPAYKYPNVEGRTTQVADYAIREFAQTAHKPGGVNFVDINPFVDGEVRYRILSDDKGFIILKQNQPARKQMHLICVGNMICPITALANILASSFLMVK